jgi:hypothetical protein
VSRSADPSVAAQLRDSPGLVVRAGWGALLLFRPDTGLGALEGSSDTSEPARAVIRILGARHLVELGLELHHGPSWRRAGGVIDAIHSVTALGFATLDHRWRRAALADALVAGAFAAGGLRSEDPNT